MMGFNRRSHADTSPAAAFTLIELLVVVAMITMMMTMLMPVMSRTHEIVRRTVCASNLRQQAIAFLDYAADSRAYVPLGYRTTAKQFNYVLYDSVHGFSMPLGRIYASGRLRQHDNWVCPSLYANQSSLLLIPWPPEKDQKKVPANCRSCFGLRTTVDTGSDSTAGDWDTSPALYAKVGHFKTSQALLSDQCQIIDKVDNGHVDGVNVAYFDGSVHYVARTLFQQDLKHLPNTDHQSGFNPWFQAIWDVFDTH